MLWHFLEQTIVYMKKTKCTENNLYLPDNFLKKNNRESGVRASGILNPTLDFIIA